MNNEYYYNINKKNTSENLCVLSTKKYKITKNTTIKVKNKFRRS